MSFEINVRSTTPRTGTIDLDEVVSEFLLDIGYLPTLFEKRTREEITGSIPYRLFVECFLKRPQKEWQIDDICMFLDTTRATVYRHLNKLKSMDLIEEINYRGIEEKAMKKAYRLRFGSLRRAWNFVEAHFKIAIENYRDTVNHIQKLADTASADVDKTLEEYKELRKGDTA